MPRVDVERLLEISGFLHNSLHAIKDTNDLDSLRGMEGEAASVYFSAFDEMILNEKEHFYFKERNRRPPLDRVNAMLSLCICFLPTNALLRLNQ
jgi:CRISPR-associated protein Cas1